MTPTAVTVGLYDTLVRYDGADEFFRELLAGQLDVADVVRYRRRYDEEMGGAFHRLTQVDFRREPFLTIKDLHRGLFERLDPEFGVTTDAAEATRRLALVVGRMPVFPETHEFVSRLRESYPHWVVSDIDDDVRRDGSAFSQENIAPDAEVSDLLEALAALETL